MSQEFTAIYEHGILRPLVPLNLPESAKVELSIRATVPNGEVSSAALEQQQVALNAMFEEVDRLPHPPSMTDSPGAITIKFFTAHRSDLRRHRSMVRPLRR